jgi:hypothetical protein
MGIVNCFPALSVLAAMARAMAAAYGPAPTGKLTAQMISPAVCADARTDKSPGRGLAEFGMPYPGDLMPRERRDEAAFIALHVICHFRQES